MSDNKTSSGGIGFTGALLIAFIVLKLCNVIAWSWWWVLSPALFWVGVGLILLAGLGIAVLFSKKADKKVVNKQGQLKSKWEQRLEEMQATKAKAEEFRAHNKL